MSAAKEKTSIPSLEALCEPSELEEGLQFRGCYEHNMDEKGRISVPAQFRSVLELRQINSLVVTNYICDGYRCLEVYPKDTWDDFERQLRKRSRFEPKLKTFENYYLSRAQVCGLDSAGRINISANLCSYAGLKKDLSLTATLHGFRIWDERVWNVVFEQAESQLLENPEVFLELDGGK